MQRVRGCACRARTPIVELPRNAEPKAKNGVRITPNAIRLVDAKRRMTEVKAMMSTCSSSTHSGPQQRSEWH